VKLFRQEPGKDDRNREGRRGGPRLPSPRRSSGPAPTGRPLRTLAFWAFVAMLALVAYKMYQGNLMSTPRVDVNYTRLVQEIDASPIHDHYVGSLAAREARRYRLR
jgi:hypothetical protein